MSGPRNHESPKAQAEVREESSVQGKLFAPPRPRVVMLLQLSAFDFASLRSFAPSRKQPTRVRSTSQSASRFFAALRGSNDPHALADDLTRRSEGAKGREEQKGQQQPRAACTPKPRRRREHAGSAEKMTGRPMRTLRSRRDAAVSHSHAEARRRKELCLNGGLFAPSFLRVDIRFASAQRKRVISCFRVFVAEPGGAA